MRVGKSHQKTRIGIIGAGLMGHALAQLFSTQGYPVSLYDDNQSVLASAPERIRKNFGNFLGLGLVTPEDVDSCLGLIGLSPSLRHATEHAGMIVEAVSERLALKQKIFAEIEEYVSPETLLCTNTSAISISQIAEPLKRRERLVGTHFWNPPHIVPCVEVIKSRFTSEEVFETAYQFMKRMGKRPVKVLQDVPGFLGNRMQHALWREAMSLVQQGIATPEDIDEVVKSGFGLRMPFVGPLETADLAGLDLSYDIEVDLFPHLENTTRPLAVLADRIEKGDLGAKTGRGFHDWPKDKLEEVLRERDRFLLRISQLVSDNQ